MSYIFTKESSCEKHEILEQLYLKYAKLMYYIAFEILNDKFLAEDVVHTAFLKLEKNKFIIDTINCNKTKSFMVIITRNIAISIYNTKKKEGIIYDYGELKEIQDDAMLPQVR
jgi:RNA polymerase sigma-70 factor (ECF subfamily)